MTEVGLACGASLSNELRKEAAARRAWNSSVGASAKHCSPVARSQIAAQIERNYVICRELEEAASHV